MIEVTHAEQLLTNAIRALAHAGPYQDAPDLVEALHEVLREHSAPLEARVAELEKRVAEPAQPAAAQSG